MLKHLALTRARAVHIGSPVWDVYWAKVSFCSKRYSKLNDDFFFLFILFSWKIYTAYISVQLVTYIKTTRQLCLTTFPAIDWALWLYRKQFIFYLLPVFSRWWCQAGRNPYYVIDIQIDGFASVCVCVCLVSHTMCYVLCFYLLTMCAHHSRI